MLLLANLCLYSALLVPEQIAGHGHGFNAARGITKSSTSKIFVYFDKVALNKFHG